MRNTLHETILRHRDALKSASHKEIAEVLGVPETAVKLAIADRNQRIRDYAAQHPELEPEQIARALKVPAAIVPRALSQRRNASRIPAKVTHDDPPTLPPLCQHDRARNARIHTSAVLSPCCLRKHPGKYLAAVLPRGEGWMAMCPQLDVTIRAAPTLDELAVQLRAAVDRTVQRALETNAFVPMPMPLEAPLPSELWGLSIAPDKARALYLRWRDEVLVRTG